MQPSDPQKFEEPDPVRNLSVDLINIINISTKRT